ASVRPEPGSNSPIKFVTGSKLANHLMIDSLTLSLFSFQRAFLRYVQRRSLVYHIQLSKSTTFLALCDLFYSIKLRCFVSRFLI
ncbi:hypothetical protein, partial [Brevibacillus sp. MER 51]|uniref:hypothetical protein n=1 Tax=Brevibacillus sp. MER 51 TaxID=2939560 RepID=UPI00203FE0D9